MKLSKQVYMPGYSKIFGKSNRNIHYPGGYIEIMFNGKKIKVPKTKPCMYTLELSMKYMCLHPIKSLSALFVFYIRK